MNKKFGTTILLISLFIHGCFKDQDAYFNSQTTPQQITAIQRSDLYPGRHVAGAFFFPVPDTAFSENIERVQLYVDNELVHSGKDSLYLNTRSFSEGEHQIGIGYVPENSNLGILNLLEAPTYVHTFSLIFDQTPPTTPKILNVEWEEGKNIITWEKNTDLNFYVYELTRILNGYGSRFGNEGLQRIRIYDQNQTTYIDENLPVLYGLSSGSYELRVDNRDHTSSYYNYYYDYGQPFSLPVGEYQPPVKSSLRDEIYIANFPDEAIEWYLPSENRSKYTLKLSSLASEGEHFVLLEHFLSNDENYLFVRGWIYDEDYYHYDNYLWRISVVNPENRVAYFLPERAYELMLHIEDDRVISLDNSLRLMDLGTAQTLDSLELLGGSGVYHITSMLRDPDDPRGFYFLNADISRITFYNDQLEYDKVLGVNKIIKGQFNQVGNQLFTLHTNDDLLTLYSSQDLHAVGTFGPKVNGIYFYNGMIRDFIVGKEKVYVSLQEALGDHQVFEIDINSQEVLRSWAFVEAPNYLLLSPDEQFLYTKNNMGGSQYVITLFE